MKGLSKETTYWWWNLGKFLREELKDGWVLDGRKGERWNCQQEQVKLINLHLQPLFSWWHGPRCTIKPGIYQFPLVSTSACWYLSPHSTFPSSHALIHSFWSTSSSSLCPLFRDAFPHPSYLILPATPISLPWVKKKKITILIANWNYLFTYVVTVRFLQ